MENPEITITEARKELGEYAHRVRATGTPITVTQNKRRAVVIVAYEQWQAIQDTLNGIVNYDHPGAIHLLGPNPDVPTMCAAGGYPPKSGVIMGADQLDKATCRQCRDISTPEEG